jgi:hypothetical protein
MTDQDKPLDNELKLEHKALCFIAVALGVITSLLAMALAISMIEALVADMMVVSPLSLLILVGSVVKEHALNDWQQQISKPIPVRMFRAFLIGFTWPLSITRR